MASPPSLAPMRAGSRSWQISPIIRRGREPEAQCRRPNSRLPDDKPSGKMGHPRCPRASALEPAGSASLDGDAVLNPHAPRHSQERLESRAVSAKGDCKNVIATLQWAASIRKHPRPEQALDECDRSLPDSHPSFSSTCLPPPPPATPSLPRLLCERGENLRFRLQQICRRARRASLQDPFLDRRARHAILHDLSHDRPKKDRQTRAGNDIERWRSR